MPRDDVNFFEIRTRIRRLLRHHAQDLSSDTRQEVNHYLEHDEFEIALEGLCLELMDAELMSAGDLLECIQLGEILQLDSGSVLKENFWEMLMEKRAELLP